MISFSFFLQSWFTNQIVICIATLYHGPERLGLYIGVFLYYKHYFTSFFVLGETEWQAEFLVYAQRVVYSSRFLKLICIFYLIDVHGYVQESAQAAYR